MVIPPSVQYSRKHLTVNNIIKCSCYHFKDGVKYGKTKQKRCVMEILQLRYFYESAKTENFTKTANKFQVPTTSVSASVKRLEKEMGCQLFDRAANRITLNSNGRLLQQTLCSVFRDLDGVAEELAAHNRDPREIKLLVRGMRRKITDLITEYSVKHSHISFKTVFDYGDTDFKEYDIIVDEENSIYTEYERIELFSMRLRLKCAANDRLCHQKISLNQLCDRPFVLMDAGSNMNKILTKACNRVGFTPQIAVLCNDIECYEKFIAAGMGIGIGRQDDTPAASAAIRDLDVVDFKEHYTVYAYYSKKEYYGKIKSFVEFLKSKGI